MMSISGNDSSLDHNSAALKRKKLETATTALCGAGETKKKLLHVFNTFLWNGLETRLGWTKIPGTGEFLGATYFVPKGVLMEESRKRKDYFDNVRDVIDRVLERRNEEEKELAEEYLRRMGFAPGTLTDKPVPKKRGPRKSKRKSPPMLTSEPVQQASPRVELRRGGSGTKYPKTKSRVGVNYQATNLPNAGSIERRDHLYEKVWDPDIARQEGVQDFVHERVHESKKEAAMVALHEQGYNTIGLDCKLNSIAPQDGSDWTDEQKRHYHAEIFSLRKDMHALSKAMDKSLSNCLTYYLNIFKKTKDYQKLKETMRNEQGECEADSSNDADVCIICGDGGRLLICDGCDLEFHKECLQPTLSETPEERWECPDCIRQTLNDARDYLLRKCRSLEETDCNRSMHTPIHREAPSSAGQHAPDLLAERSPDKMHYNTSPEHVEADEDSWSADDKRSRKRLVAERDRDRIKDPHVTSVALRPQKVSRKRSPDGELGSVSDPRSNNEVEAEKEAETDSDIEILESPAVSNVKSAIAQAYVERNEDDSARTNSVVSVQNPNTQRVASENLPTGKANFESSNSHIRPNQQISVSNDKPREDRRAFSSIDLTRNGANASKMQVARKDSFSLASFSVGQKLEMREQNYGVANSRDGPCDKTEQEKVFESKSNVDLSENHSAPKMRIGWEEDESMKMDTAVRTLGSDKLRAERESLHGIQRGSQQSRKRPLIDYDI